MLDRFHLSNMHRYGLCEDSKYWVCSQADLAINADAAVNWQSKIVFE
jgi:hypothetical protein